MLVLSVIHRVWSCSPVLLLLLLLLLLRTHCSQSVIVQRRHQACFNYYVLGRLTCPYPSPLALSRPISPLALSPLALSRPYLFLSVAHQSSNNDDLVTRSDHVHHLSDIVTLSLEYSMLRRPLLISVESDNSF